MWFLLFLWVVVLIAALWLYIQQGYAKFDKFGVKYIKTLKSLGYTFKFFTRRLHFIDFLNEMYKSFPEEKFFGTYEFSKEKIMVRDVDLIKKITVKDFDHFSDHHTIFDASESFFARTLISLKGQEWRDMRSTLSPAFTSSKIRHMVPFMVEVGDQMVQALKKKIRNSDGGYFDIECKDLTTRYANDVIASCAFGLKVDSHTDENNEFYAMGKATSTFQFSQIFVFILMNVAPTLVKWLKLDFLTTASKDFFSKLVLGTMKNREEQKILRPDMIHLLMEARKGQLKHDDVKSTDEATGFATVQESSVGTKAVNRTWTDEDLVAQAVLFFMAGFETVSSAMSFMLYELALNPDVQEKLAQEIKEHNETNQGKFDFNSIQNMTYMDMVVSEVLRMWTPGVALDRLCIKDYNMGKPNDNADKDYVIRKGTAISILSYSIHRDPKYYPNPDKFDPERFSEENKDSIQPAAYMPFGAGPRNCIGSRFALCEIKAMTYQLLLNFELSPCEKTCIPPEFCTKSFSIQLKGGFWIRFKERP